MVKLYFKREALTRHRVQVVLSLMSAAQKSKKHRVAMMDVLRSKLYIDSAQNLQMEALLKGEAATFLGIWNSLAQQG